MRLKWSMSKYRQPYLRWPARPRPTRARRGGRAVRRGAGPAEQALQVALERAAVVQAGELVAFALVEQRDVVGVDARKPSASGWHHRAAPRLRAARRPAPGLRKGSAATAGACQRRRARLAALLVHAPPHRGQHGVGLIAPHITATGRARRRALHHAFQSAALRRAFAQHRGAGRRQFGEREREAVIERIDVAMVGERRHRIEQCANVPANRPRSPGAARAARARCPSPARHAAARHCHVGFRPGPSMFRTTSAWPSTPLHGAARSGQSCQRIGRDRPGFNMPPAGAGPARPNVSWSTLSRRQPRTCDLLRLRTLNSNGWPLRVNANRANPLPRPPRGRGRAHRSLPPRLKDPSPPIDIISSASLQKLYPCNFKSCIYKFIR